MEIGDSEFMAAEDFEQSYFPGFERLFWPEIQHPNRKAECYVRMMHYYDKAEYSGYPKEPGGSVWISEGKALYTMIRILKPKHILEIGNFQGCSANHILQAVETNNSGIVDLLDISEQLNYPNLHNHNFERILADSIEYLDQPLEYDLYVIDGDHSYEHTKKELELIIANTTVPCWIWAHDYHVTHDISCQVRKTWDEMKPHFSKFETFKDSISNCGFVIAKYEN